MQKLERENYLIEISLLHKRTETKFYFAAKKKVALNCSKFLEKK